jgi:cytidylate kinase
MIIAIDGFSSCGKSTLARDLANRLGYIYVDTGAMYRAVTLFAIRKGLVTEKGLNGKALEQSLPEINISFHLNIDNQQNELYLNGLNVEAEIRGMEVSQRVSEVSTLKMVREKLVDLQQQMGKNTSLVMDGRDIGTVVFPNAQLKIFVTASEEIRAQRRYNELIAKGMTVGFDEIKANIRQRDTMDQNRSESPLRKADDALVLDNSSLDRNQQLEWVLNVINSIE